MDKDLDKMTDAELKEELARTRSERVEANKKAEEDKVAAEAAVKEAEEAEKAKPRTEKTGELSEDQWVEMERHYGMSREDISKFHKIGTALIQPVQAENKKLREELAIEKTVSGAMKVEAAKDKQFSKLKPFVEEYLQDVPAEFKSDPKRLAKEMERAIKYAKGSLPVASRTTVEEPVQTRRGVPVVERHLEEGNDGGQGDPEAEVYGQVHRGDASLPFAKVGIDDRVGKDYRKLHTRENASGDGTEVRIRHKQDWSDAEKRLKGKVPA